MAETTKLEDVEQGTTHHYLSEEVIQEILVRLPLKSILRFKSTCKTWYSLIQSRSFVQFHRRHNLDDDHRNYLFFSSNHTGGPHFISCFSSPPSKHYSTPLFDLGPLTKALTGDETRFPNSPDELAGPDFIVLGPLNNGICCVIAQRFVREHRNIAICNPATREFNLLRDDTCDGQGRLNLEHFYGFASIIHNNNNNNNNNNNDDIVVDYKIVGIQQDIWDDSFRASVYSLRRGSWDLICDSDHSVESYASLARLVNEEGKVEFPMLALGFWLPGQSFLNGSCHWMAHMKSKEYSPVVLQFDMTNEVFNLIGGPPVEFELQSGIFVLDDHLASIILLVEGQYIDHIDVWMMKEYGVETSWMKFHSCEIHLVGEIGRFLGTSFSRVDGGITIERMFFQLWTTVSLISCDRSASVQTHCAFEHCWACWKTLGLSAYVKTLEPVTL